MAEQVVALRSNWRLGAPIGSGGFGRVFETEAPDGSAAVVKLVPKVPGADRELLFESVANTPNVIPILDSGEWQDYYVLVMPRAQQTLSERLADAGGRLMIEEAVRVLVDIAEALAGLHGVVHRDLKPDNVLLYGGHWCLADFGIARYAEATTAPDTRKFSMTPTYAAPEQWRGERATPVTDIYAFGVIAFQLIQGQLPFGGPALHDLRDQHLNQRPPICRHGPAVARDVDS